MNNHSFSSDGGVQAFERDAQASASQQCTTGPKDDEDDNEREDEDYDDVPADEQENLPGGPDQK